MNRISAVTVLDASAIINLNATGCAADILRALPDRIVAVDIVAGEVEEGRKTGRSDADQLNELKAAGLIEIVSLGDVGEALFERLVVGPAHATLDDGEAATIAYAVEHTLGIVVDDKKARRICQELFPGVQRQCSIDIFRHPSVGQSLGRDQLALAVVNALQVARMRVLAEDLKWIINLIGKDKATACRSLPRRLLDEHGRKADARSA